MIDFMLVECRIFKCYACLIQYKNNYQPTLVLFDKRNKTKKVCIKCTPYVILKLKDTIKNINGQNQNS